MKKLLILLLGTLLLVSCQSGKDTDKRSKEKTDGDVVVENTESTIKFQDGTLETDKFNLTILKTEVIQSQAEDKPGLFITYNLTNKTKNEDIVPSDTLMYLTVQQDNETSRVELVDNYHFLDAFGDDTSTYNKMVDLENASENALLPGKSVDFVAAYGLDNDTYDVTFSGIDQDTFKEVGKHTIKIK